VVTALTNLFPADAPIIGFETCLAGLRPPAERSSAAIAENDILPCSYTVQQTLLKKQKKFIM
jgi:hypothetical protein